MTRRWRLVAGIAGVVVLAGVAAGLAVGLSEPAGSPAAAPVRLAPSQQEHLEKAITAPAVTSQAGAVAQEVRGQFLKQGQPLLPPGSRLSISGATFHVVSARMATVNATVTGPQAGRWQLVLVREAGRWLLIGTKRLS
jgi:hypothetical protein